MRRVFIAKGTIAALSSLMLFLVTGPASAQSAGEAFLEEILVTATKRTGGIDVQQAGVAITAYNDTQLDAMYVRDLKALGYAAPSVQMEDIGTTRGTANFSIRGLGINSSIPSIDPTVGVFIDGMYLGLNSGVVLDIFDLEGVEVLRGPQGLLFGRNVTGGAVLLRTSRPTEELSINTRAAFETGENVYVSGVISGPLGDNVNGKIAAYFNDDGGWFENLANGNDKFGQAETTLVRGAIDWTPGDNFDLIVRVEHGESEGDGPASQNAGLFSTDSFDFAIDEEGAYDAEWNHIIAEAAIDVDFGEGQIVNILAYREYEGATRGDIDATPADVFWSPTTLDQDQISNELRYNGTFGDIYLTTGVYYFSQDMEYVEQRNLFGFVPAVAVTLVGGGNVEAQTSGVFAQIDYAVSDIVTFNFGGRYTKEKKEAEIATLLPQPNGGLNSCSLAAGCTSFDFIDDESWSNFTPKIGMQIAPDDDTQVYAFWTKGFRSGGYNVRNTSPTASPGPFNEEEQNSIEVGLKKDLADGRLRVNLAGYFNQIDDMQREVNLADPTAGVVQIIQNTADATISGFDAELSWLISEAWFLQLSAGYVDGSYDEVLFDLNGDGAVSEADRNLDLPRLAPWSYGASLTFDQELPFGSFRAQVSGYHRDAAAYTDNNLGQLREADMIDASLTIRFMEDKLLFSVFGRNLGDESTIGGDTQLPAVFGVPNGTFSPLNKGRTYGAELQYKY